jgi:hypothetical protein
LGCRTNNEYRNGAISMKSILQSIALLSAAVLIASCDSSSGGGASAVITPPAPQVSATGSGTKGIIVGGAVTVTDADGDQIGSSVTAADGTYDIAYDAAAVAAGVTDPLTITITGGQAQCDFDNAGTANDCPTGNPAPNDFVAFGVLYDLPATFALRSLAPAASAGGISHVTPLSEIATLKALEKAGATSTASLTAAQVSEANLALGGLFEAITGISLGGVDITQLKPADITVTGGTTASALQQALAAFAAAIVGDQASGESLQATILRLSNLFTIGANGQVTGTGTNLGLLTAAIAKSLAVVSGKTGNTAIASAVNNANSLATVYTNLGAGTVTVPAATVTGNVDNALAQTKTFVTKLAQIVGEVTAATGAQGSGDDGSVGATEAFVTELDAVANLSSGNATKALTKLSDAIIAASQTVVAGTDVVNDATSEDGITLTLSVDADGALTLSNVSSVWPLMEATGGNTVTVTVSDDTANTASAPVAATDIDAAEASTFSLTGVTMVTTTGTTTLQTFTGDISNTYDATAGTDSFALVGNVTGSSTGTGSTFGINVSVSNEPRGDTDGTSGTYSASFTFTGTGASDDLTLTLSGTVGAALQGFTVNTESGSAISGTVTRTGTTDVNTLTDGVATLTLTVTNGSVVADSLGVIGTFTVGTGELTTTTATLDNTGVVTFTDSSILLLPAIIFVPDN